MQIIIYTKHEISSGINVRRSIIKNPFGLITFISTNLEDVKCKKI